MKKVLVVSALVLGLYLPARGARAASEAVTLPVVLADYYGFAYAQAFLDHSYGYAYPTAAVDALGWGLVAFHRYPGLVCVNLAGAAKTLYPMAKLCGKPSRSVRRRAWASLGTHAATLLWLKAWGKPALHVEGACLSDGAGMRVALAF